jgi:hypothetical protein
MAKVFRFHEGNNNVEDWQITSEYDNTAIDGIKDPDGATAKKQITSIPSPFARIDLVQTAFKRVVDSGDLNGTTIYHKMVSDSFDVGEIFFNHTRFSHLIEIIAWDKENDLDALLNSDNRQHKLLGETLKLYLDQDADSYNFSQLRRLYLLNYKTGPNQINIIGGTSPCSLFFSSANGLEYAQTIRFGSDVAFDESYQPLYKRDLGFVKYIFYLRNMIPEFPQRFKFVDEYLTMTYRRLGQTEASIVNNLVNAEYFDEFDELYVSNPGDLVEINGAPLRKKKPDLARIENTSQFVIVPTKAYAAAKPIVLPSVKADYGMIYTTDNWDKNYKPVFEEHASLDNRILPYTMEPYPFLTVSDFLEPTIIRTVFLLNRDKFYDGDLQDNNATKSYILPLKKEFFQFFSINDLKGTMRDGKKMFQISNITNGGVKVELRIPIRGNNMYKYITYERIYYPGQRDGVAEPKIAENKGAVLENQFNLLLYPFIKISGINNHYRIGIIDRDIQPWTMQNDYKLQFFPQHSIVPATVDDGEIKIRSQKKRDGFTSKYYILQENFDYIQLHNGQSTGIIIPNFVERQQGNLQFAFAIDFGTTNTHVEYTQDGGSPQPLEITERDMQLATLHDRKFFEQDRSLNGTSAIDIIDVIRNEFIPEFIGSEQEFKFPTRTAISSDLNLKSNVATYALADFNMSFAYEKYPRPSNTEISTNLKWANYTGTANNREMKRIEAYFENLMLLIRNKILLNDGNLNSSEFIWFYPSSMEKYRRNQLESKWQGIYNKYIAPAGQALKLSESIAPFYYFNRELGISAAGRPVVSMDIGGGTTDIVVYSNDSPSVLTSVRFAANAIFGDGFNGSSRINGFINTFKSQIAQKLEANNLKDLTHVFNELIEKGTSADIIAFFFSIENNKKVKEKNIPISFNGMLAEDNDLKIIFLLFYSSLIYHVAKVMKLKGLKSPRYVTFSGTGSKVINIADASSGLYTLSELTSIIFRKVMDEDYGHIGLSSYDAPKEITCKGGLKIPHRQEINGGTINITTPEGKVEYAKYIDSIKATLLGDADDTMLSETVIRYDILKDPKKRSELEGGIIEEYNRFITLFFSINEECSFTNEFGVSPVGYRKAKEILQSNDDVRMYLNAGIKEKLDYLGDNTDVEIEESFFFYPLVGGMNKLAYEIYKSTKQQ